ncbi:hypothetical protein J7E73_03875 [Paenibacillus albidus]|uniref:hypothetical protein n=1 Tax=Paenibacillus albidus TaxID=2041023 RepID=UPI001BE67285|nr:hypothetical protein [Paenibacillus albidus]MBT2288287.1 hypothetical protein [Paenibacillus albidus]
MKRIGCFHAHYSNIEHIERALANYEVELVHFVDPGLDRMKKDEDFSAATVEQKVMDTLDWIAKSHVDAILITCTLFTAVFDPEIHRYNVPVICIDDPLFEDICGRGEAVVVAFTNPGTVEGSMNQLLSYARKQGKQLQAEPVLLENTFELIMSGRKSEYLAAVSAGLSQLVKEHPGKRVIAAQLSMVPAAALAEEQTGARIGNQLDSLAAHLEELLELAKPS